MRGSRNAQRSMIARVCVARSAVDANMFDAEVACCRATEASVLSIVAAAFRLTVTIESRRSMGVAVLNRASQNAASEVLANAASCIMSSLHKTSGNALVEPRISIEIRHPLPCPDAGDALVALHGYHGLTGDGQIYAFQAFARLHPQLTADLYLQNTSQDQFTLFSPLYAWCIGLLGLENAARLLTLLFTFGSWRRPGVLLPPSPVATPPGWRSRCC